jgi:hypothetical protein
MFDPNCSGDLPVAPLTREYFRSSNAKPGERRLLA